jgi:hypothetical protein
MTTIAYRQRAMTITKLALFAMTAVAAAIGLPAAAHADEGYDFQSPSGNIHCKMGYAQGTDPGVVCTIAHSTYAGQRQSGLVGWPQFGLWQGGSPSSPKDMPCVVGGSKTPISPTLDYGQKTRAFGVISCDSEQSGVTCTDSSTGHFFRVSSESYYVG